MNEYFCPVRDFAKSLKPKTNEGFCKIPKTDTKEKKTNLADQNKKKSTKVLFSNQRCRYVDMFM